MMSYSGNCACKEISFSFDLDPMMHFMCHCTDCQVMFNGSFEGYAISEDELKIEGNLSNFTYAGGSGLNLHVNTAENVVQRYIPSQIFFKA